MINEADDKKSFEIFGKKITFRPQEDKSLSPINVDEIVQRIKLESEKIQDKFPSMSNDSLALMVSLELSKSLLLLEYEFKNSLNLLSSQFHSIQDIVDEVKTLSH